jgi:DNA-binding NarL/FixJ family response regulator
MPITVAIVEDSQTIRESLQHLVEEAPGMKCHCAVGSAEEALKELPRCQPQVVLMDIHLPNMSGIECTARLKAQLPQASVIMLTVYEDNDRIFKALQAGACGYLLKRTRPEQLLQAIRDVQQGGAPMTSEIARRVVEAFRTPPAIQKAEIELSRREREVLELVGRGYSNKDVAEYLCVTIETVRHHLKAVYEKLHVHSRTEAVLKFLGVNAAEGAAKPANVR